MGLPISAGAGASLRQGQTVSCGVQADRRFLRCPNFATDLSGIRGVPMRLHLIGIASLLLVQSAHAQSFKCRYARSPAEVTICNSPRLSTMDEQLSRLYFALRNANRGTARRMIEQRQVHWLADRNRCGSSTACIAEAYRNRFGELNSISRSMH